MRKVERPEDIRLPKALELISRKKGAAYRQGKTQRYVMDLGVGTILRAASLLPELVFRTAVVLETGRPSIYLSKREGKDGVVFEARKIRTMYKDADKKGSRFEQGHAFHDEEDPRVTRVGRWLRRHDFDEITNLTNVRRGDMSLVGPRAATPGDGVKLKTILTSDELKERQQWFADGKPGVFNAPVAFARERLREGDDKLGHEWNRYYADNASVGLELYIVGKTFSSRVHHKAERAMQRLRHSA